MSGPRSSGSSSSRRSGDGGGGSGNGGGGFDGGLPPAFSRFHVDQVTGAMETTLTPPEVGAWRCPPRHQTHVEPSALELKWHSTMWR